MTQIVEYIGRCGVKTYNGPWNLRMKQPRPGDWVQFPEELRKYPVSHEYCRITGINEDHPERIILVDGDGSCFLRDDASLDVSGGPFFGMFEENLEPTYEFRKSEMWNWADRTPGADQGVYYQIMRPVFRALRTPGDFEQRIAFDEPAARMGGMFNRSWIPTHAKLIRTYEEHVESRGKGVKEFWFDVREEKDDQPK